MVKKSTRIYDLANLMQERKSLSVREAAEILKVSEMTIRRDLDVLQDHQSVKRVYGKAVLVEGSSGALKNIENDYSLTSAGEAMLEQKNAIGRYAASLLEPGDVLILDNGSTINSMASFLPDNIPLTVACYNINILVKIYQKENIQPIFMGGYYHRSDQMFESLEGLQFLKSIRANKLFLSASGVHQNLGLTCAHDFEVSVKQTVLRTALQKILLVDSSKFGAVTTVYFAPMDDVDMIITDSGISAEWRQIIHSRGVELVVP